MSDAQLADAQLAQAVVAEARTWIGTPFRHRASVRGAGCDCLGLVRGVWRAVHGAEPTALPHYPEGWDSAEGEALLLGLEALLPRAAAPGRAGDVLLFQLQRGMPARHLGVQTDTPEGPRFVHAFIGHGVVESALGGVWARRVVARFWLRPVAAPAAGTRGTGV